MRKGLLFILLFAFVAMAQTTVKYRIRMPNSGYSAQLRGIASTRTAGITINGTYDANFSAHTFTVTVSGRYDLYYDASGGSTYTKDTGWSGNFGKYIATGDFMDAVDTDFDNKVDVVDDAAITATQIKDSVVSLQKMTTAAVNYIGSGGSVTNNPDDKTLENKTGSTIGIKDGFDVVADTTALKALTVTTPGARYYLKQLSATDNTGGGEFVYFSSGYAADNYNIFNASGGGSFVRQAWLNDDNHVTNKTISKYMFFWPDTTLRTFRQRVAVVNHGGSSVDNHLRVLTLGSSINGFTTFFREDLHDFLGYAGLGIIQFGNNVYSGTIAPTVTVTLSAGWTVTDEGATDELWGIGGSSIKTSGTTETINVTMDAAANYTNARLWYATKATGGGTFDVTIDGTLKGTINTQTGMNSIASVTYTGLTDKNNSFYIDNITTGEVVLYGVEIWADQDGAIVYNLTNGGSAAHQWDDHLEYIKTFVATINPDIIFITHGTNDAGDLRTAYQFKASLASIIDSLKSVNIKTPIIINAPNKQQSSSVMSYLRAYKPKYKELQREKGVSFFSIFDFWPDYNTANNLGLMGDGTHPNTQGNEAISLKIMELLGVNSGGKYAFQNSTNVFNEQQIFAKGISSRDAPTGKNGYEYKSGGSDKWWIDKNGFMYLSEGTRLYFKNSAGDLQLRVNSGNFQIYSGSTKIMETGTEKRFKVNQLDVLNLNSPPASATATGTVGQIIFGSDGYIYLCTATNTWLRVQLTTW